LANFSGYLAVDELYDGPFCVLSIVDNRTHRRLTHRVLEQSPKARNVKSFLSCFKKELTRRQLSVRGITTDASPLYPDPLAQVFKGVPHQVCTFHILKELNTSALRSVASVRKQMKAKLPRLPRGRPQKGVISLQSQARQKEAEKIAALFEHRRLFVRRRLSSAQRQKLEQITTGLPHLRALRQIIDQVYGLFDRRCRGETALAKLAQLQRQIGDLPQLKQVLKKLYSPHLQKALTFLDDKLLPSTSNAVERGNRRHRKMQKTIYRVRTRRSLEQRLALDLEREMRLGIRQKAARALHEERSPNRFANASQPGNL
jgi:hypothetical protein